MKTCQTNREPSSVKNADVNSLLLQRDNARDHTSKIAVDAAERNGYEYHILPIRLT